jgi:hypothetical protein
MMPEDTPPRLRIVSQEGRYFVLVPPQWAGDLRILLRSKGVTSSPPEPVGGDMVSVELGKKTDTGAVQVLLDGWVSCA